MRIVPTRKLTRVLVALVLITLAAFLSGPRVTVSPKLPTIELPACQGLGEYVKRQEEVFQDRLIPGAEKTIRFQHEDHRKTKFSLVYVHGFSASRQDCCPVPELVAEHLEANTFYARLAAHGLRDEDFANVSANDWLNDIHEAVEIGKQLGDRVVLMGHSTGGTLGLWRANIDDSQVEAVVLLSPNFGIANKNAGYALYPWGKQIVRIFSGPYAGFEPVNSEHALYWTERYRTEAVAEVIALVNFCCAEDYAAFRVPSLCVYSEQDKVVSLKRIREQWTEIDPSKEWLYALPASKGHSLAGDVLSPETTSPLVGKITEFLDEVVTLTH